MREQEAETHGAAETSKVVPATAFEAVAAALRAAGQGALLAQMSAALLSQAESREVAPPMSPPPPPQQQQKQQEQQIHLPMEERLRKLATAQDEDGFLDLLDQVPDDQQSALLAIWDDCRPSVPGPGPCKLEQSSPTPKLAAAGTARLSALKPQAPQPPAAQKAPAAAHVPSQASAEEAIAERKMKHARYQRYWRGSQNRRRCGEAIWHRIRQGCGHLYDLWLESKECWTSVQIQFKKWESVKFIKYSAEHYRTRGQLMQFYHDDSALVDDIIAEKRLRGPPWVIPHPESPKTEVFLTWAGAGARREEETGHETALSGKANLQSDQATNDAMRAMMHKGVPGNDAVLAGLPGDGGGSQQEKKNDEKEEQEKPAEEPVVPKKEPKVRDPWDIARGHVSRMARNAKGARVKLQGVRLEIDSRPAEDTNKEIYKARATEVATKILAIENACDAALALNKKANTLFLEGVKTKYDDDLTKHVKSVNDLDKMVNPVQVVPKVAGAKRAATKGKARAKPKPS